MTCPPLPSPDRHGWFQPVLPAAPETWPWALPYLAAVNVAPDPHSQVVEAVASADGKLVERRTMAAEAHRLEVIGYWKGEFGIVHFQRFASVSAAMKEANDLLKVVPVHYLLKSGKVLRIHRHLDVTGEWPRHWRFRRGQHLGVCCAFVYDQAREHGARKEAEAFKRKVWYEGSPAEQVGVYVDALDWAEQHLSRWLDVKDIRVLKQAVAQGREWLCK